MINYPGSTLIEITHAARHTGHGRAMEIFVISSEQASVVLIRQGEMVGAGLDTKFSDIERIDGKWLGVDHHKLALDEAADIVAAYEKGGYTNEFNDNPTSPGYVVRSQDCRFLDVRNKNDGFEFQWAVEHLFSCVTFHRIMWDLFPDMECDFGLEIKVGSEAINAQKTNQYAGTWGAW